MRSLALDTTPLRTNAAFRALWASAMVSRLGSMVTYVAMPYQIKQLTHSYVAVGTLGAVEIAPIIIFGLYGGALADRLDRRTVSLITEAAFALCVGALALNSFVGSPRVWVLYVVAIAMAALDGLQRPSMNALVPRIVPREQMTAASALMSLTGSTTLVLGTTVGGLLVVSIGLTNSYLIDVASFLLSLLLLVRLPSIAATHETHESPLRAIREATSYALSRRDLLGTYLIDTIAMTFAYPNALFPFLADAVHSPRSLGLLYAAGSVGATIATVTSGWTKRITRHGVAVIIAASCWGIAIAAAGMTTSLALVLLCLALAGAADMVSALFRSLIWNLTIPDHLRGRMAGIELLSYAVGPQLGQMRSGVAASAYGMRNSLVSGGLLCVGCVAAVSRMLPALRHYRHTTQHS